MPRSDTKSPRFGEAHYRTLFESIDVGFCTIEVLFDEHGAPEDYRFLDVNPAFVAQTGLRHAVGRRMRELAPNHEAHWFEIYGRVALSGEPVRFEQPAQALGRWFSVFAFRVDAPEDRRVAILFSDITEQRHALDDLNASEARYRALAHAAESAVYRLAPDGSRLIEVFGGFIQPEDGPVAGEADLTTFVHPDHRERVTNAWNAAVLAGTPFEAEHLARRRDGSWSWVHSRAVPVRNNAGELIEWMGSSTDITSRKASEEAMRHSEESERAARAEAERANQAKDAFLAMVGHELRNPLAPMLTALELMRLRGQHSREQEVLERQVAHLSRIVEDLLDVSRITRGEIELRRQPVELCEIVVRAMEIASPLLEQHQQQVELHLPSSGLVIDADLQRMAQVLSNLLTNAARYSPRGSRVTVTGRRTGGTVHVRVSDEGMGIAADMLEAVFEPFVQQVERPEHARGGLGLGLAIVRNLVSAHGGTVRAMSEGPNRGTVFILELPAHDGPPATDLSPK